MRVFNFLFLLLCLTGCSRKDDPVPQSLNPNPVFTVRGDVEGNPLLMEAGNGNVYMNSYFYKPANYFVFAGSFGKYKCLSCPGNFNINFIAASPAIGNSGDSTFINQTLFDGKQILFAKFIDTSATVYGKAYIAYYTDSIVYTSVYPNQPDSSKITILSVENYLPNEQGQKTKKVKLSFNCRLYCQNPFDSIELKNMQVTMAVAYP